MITFPHGLPVTSSLAHSKPVAQMFATTVARTAATIQEVEIFSVLLPNTLIPPIMIHCC